MEVRIAALDNMIAAKLSTTAKNFRIFCHFFHAQLTHIAILLLLHVIVLLIILFSKTSSRETCLSVTTWQVASSLLSEEGEHAGICGAEQLGKY